MRASKKWVIIFLVLFLTILVLTGGFIAIIDPYFHYHKPLSWAGYFLDNERYQNNGIVKNFDYDAIITGSSMTECFKPSELDELFGVNAIKVPFAGGSYKEVNDNLAVAVRYNPDIKMIVRCLDCNRFFNSKDDLDYSDYPTYLYDDSLLNDVGYLFNVNVLFDALQSAAGYSSSGRRTLSFDDYCNWSNNYLYGKEEVDKHYNRDSIVRAEKMLPITEEEYVRIRENIEQNVTRLADENPDIEFYIYFSPYSIYYMDYWYQLGELQRQLQAEKYIIELILPHKNIHLYSFYTEYDTICDLDNYKDVAHHRGEINSQILRWIREGKNELTYDNYEEYCRKVWDFYMNYDYDSLFE